MDSTDFRLFATDLDGTLLGDAAAAARFKRMWEAEPEGKRPLLCYSSGRLLEDVQAQIANGLLPQPDYIIGGVGTAVYDVAQGQLLKQFTEVLEEGWDRETVEKALRHFEGDRHEMLAWTVMPNHVHALLRPLHEHLLEDLCGSWKWFTASKIQAALQRAGPLWQEENFDRIIRDAAHYEKAVRYIANNPVKANLPPGQASAGFCQSIRAANGWP